jgi:hypothetical protein
MQALDCPLFSYPLMGGEAPGPLATRWGGKNISKTFQFFIKLGLANGRYILYT